MKYLLFVLTFSIIVCFPQISTSAVYTAQKVIIEEPDNQKNKRFRKNIIRGIKPLLLLKENNIFLEKLLAFYIKVSAFILLPFGIVGLIFGLINGNKLLILLALGALLLVALAAYIFMRKLQTAIY